MSFRGRSSDRSNSVLFGTLAFVVSTLVGCSDPKGECNSRGDCDSSAGANGAQAGDSSKGGVTGVGYSSLANPASTGRSDTAGDAGAPNSVGSFGGSGSSGGSSMLVTASTGSIGLASAGGIAMAGSAGVGAIPCSVGCPAAFPACDARKGICVGCTTDADCGADKPICNTASNTCVACLSSANCAAPTPVCRTADNSCVACTTNALCSGTKPFCRTDASICVQCLSSADCREAGKRTCDPVTNTCTGCVTSSDCTDPKAPICHPTRNQCVSCMSNDDCQSAAASRCDLNSNTCLPCANDGDCRQVSGKGICQTGSTAQANRCVECTTTNELPCIEGNIEYSCNPRSNECTSTRKASRRTCESCVADSECGTNEGAPDPNSRCVPMAFKGSAHGAYCLIRAMSVNLCPRPYSVGIEAISLSGAPQEAYCGLNQNATTCEAVFSTFNVVTCSADSQCGGGQGGLCRQVIGGSSPPKTCTIPCASNDQCMIGKSCTSASGGYCK